MGLDSASVFLISDCILLYWIPFSEYLKWHWTIVKPRHVMAFCCWIYFSEAIVAIEKVASHINEMQRITEQFSPVFRQLVEDCGRFEVIFLFSIRWFIHPPSIHSPLHRSIRDMPCSYVPHSNHQVVCLRLLTSAWITWCTGARARGSTARMTSKAARWGGTQCLRRSARKTVPRWCTSSVSRSTVGVWSRGEPVMIVDVVDDSSTIGDYQALA